MLALRSKRAALVVLAAWTMTAGPPANADDLVLSPTVWAAFQQYLHLSQPGAFAVSSDGAVSGFSYCEELRCEPNYEQPGALSNCKSNGGSMCVIFAIGDKTVVPYRVRTE